MPDPARRYFIRLRREHTLTRDRVDSLPWPHPRPLRDERLQALHIAFIWTSVIQIIFGPPPTTMQATTFGYVATVFFSVLMIICCALNLYAAHCKSQYNSFGFEMAGTAGFAGVFLIYSVGLIFGVTNWWGTNTMALAVALCVGNLMRCIKLVRRLW
jgi:hypothetical protein